MAYRAFLNNTLFFQTDAGLDELMLTSAVINKVAGESGSFVFKVPQQNIAYTSFHKLIDYVDVFKDDVLIFSGRVYAIRETFDTQIEVECEGLLAVLNDSIIRPFLHNDTVENLLLNLIAQHNMQVGSDKQITVRSVTIEDKNLIAYRDYQEYQTTIERINTLVDSFGGYISVTKTAGGLMFDWLESFTTDAGQTIDFGENLLDITQEETSDDIITVLIPLGKEMEDADGMLSGARLTIAGVNDGLDYIEADSTYIQQYGRIVGTKIWDDVTVPSILKSKAQAELNARLQGKVLINVSAVDMADAGYNVDAFTVGEQIKVTSAPHGISGVWFACTEQTLNLLHPGSNRLTLGSVEYGYIKLKRQQDNSILSGIINANYQLNEAMRGINQDLIYRISTFESTIEQLPESITATVLESVTDQYGDQLETLQSAVQQLSNSYTLWFGNNGRINTWFEFDPDYFKIRKDGQAVYSRQDNDSYEFCDNSGNVLLGLDGNGMTALTANVTGQLRFMNGSAGQWAIRKGAYISSLGGVNLDDVWIG